MHVLEAERGVEIQRLGLNAALTSFLLTLTAQGSLQEQFQAPWHFYSQGYPANPGHWPQIPDRRLLPLWEHEELVYAADLARRQIEYVSFYIEAPEDVRVLGTSPLCAIFDALARHVWEYGGDLNEASEALALARELKFPEISVLESLLLNPNAQDAAVGAYIHSLALSELRA